MNVVDVDICQEIVLVKAVNIDQDQKNTEENIKVHQDQNLVPNHVLGVLLSDLEKMMKILLKDIKGNDLDLNLVLVLDRGPMYFLCLKLVTQREVRWQKK